MPVLTTHGERLALERELLQAVVVVRHVQRLAVARKPRGSQELAGPVSARTQVAPQRARRDDLYVVAAVTGDRERVVVRQHREEALYICSKTEHA